MVLSTGNGLGVLITCDYTRYHNWMSFATWYSVYQNMPDATIALLSSRRLSEGVVNFNWAYNCDIKFFQHENLGDKIGCDFLNKLYGIYVALKEGIIQQPFIVLDPTMVSVSELSVEHLDLFNSDLKFGYQDGILYFNGLELKDFENCIREYRKEYDLMNLLTKILGKPEILEGICCDCKLPEMSLFSHYENGCGRFQLLEWMRKTDLAPFAYVRQLSKKVSMTPNEIKILRTWAKAEVLFQNF